MLQQTATLQSSITVLSQVRDRCCSRCKILCLMLRKELCRSFDLRRMESSDLKLDYTKQTCVAVKCLCWYSGSNLLESRPG